MRPEKLTEYIHTCKPNRRFILVKATGDMLTKTGVLRRRWHKAFFTVEDEAKAGMQLPKAGGCLEEKIPFLRGWKGRGLSCPTEGAFLC